MSKTFNTKEGFDRPNHADFMDASELRAMKFSGMRHNSISEDIEIWTEGDLRKSISQAERAIRPNAVEEAFAEIFKLYVVEIEGR